MPEDVERYKLPGGFQKNLGLYNLHRLESPEHVVLVESYWSVFRLDALVVPAVALMGRSLSVEQEELLAQSGATRITLLLDGDKAGRAAAEEPRPRLATRFFVHAPEVPDGFKPHAAEEGLLRTLLLR